MNDVTHSAGPRVLVVDDHLVSRLYTVAALRQIGAAVKAVETGEEALVAAMRWRPEAIITDIHLPGLSGLELVQRIRQGWPGQRLPRMILLSAAPAARPAAGSAADAILAKPATPAQLRAALQGKSAGVGQYRVMEGRVETSPDQLQDLFRQELAGQLPALEASLAGRDLQGAGLIVHRLLASSRLCGERRLERSLQALHAACLRSAPVGAVACGYYGLLAAAGHYLASPAPR